MQSLNDDMNEELFRRAADEYPLNTDGADWNKVMQAMRQPEEDSPQNKHKQNNYKYLLLLLLLPIGFICGKYAGKDKTGNSVKTNINKSEKNTSSPIKQKQQYDKVDKPMVENKSESILKDTGSSKESNDKNNKIKNSSATSGVSNSGRYHENISSKNTGNETTGSVAKINHSVIDQSNKTFNKTSNKIPDNKADNYDAVKGVITYPENEKASEKVSKYDTENVPADKIATTLNHPLSLQKEEVKTDTTATGTKPVADTKTINTKDKKQSTQKSFKGKLYYSFVIGPDVSTIKLQRINKVGYSAGLTLGYQLSKKISVEAGALWDRKNYYTNGQYLDTSRLKLPRHLMVLNADGYCDMIEIPVNIKYDFSAKKDHSWFVSAGVSSYIMKNEDYNLAYKMYNMTGARDYGYKNSTKDWFSIMNVSAGYQKTLGKNTNIRFAPYIKIPLKGVGIGKLPITSSGIYITLSRSFH